MYLLHENYVDLSLLALCATNVVNWRILLIISQILVDLLILTNGLLSEILMKLGKMQKSGKNAQLKNNAKPTFLSTMYVKDGQRSVRSVSVSDRSVSGLCRTG